MIISTSLIRIQSSLPKLFLSSEFRIDCHFCKNIDEVYSIIKATLPGNETKLSFSQYEFWAQIGIQIKTLLLHFMKTESRFCYFHWKSSSWIKFLITLPKKWILVIPVSIKSHISSIINTDLLQLTTCYWFLILRTLFCSNFTTYNILHNSLHDILLVFFFVKSEKSNTFSLNIIDKFSFNHFWHIWI